MKKTIIDELAVVPPSNNLRSGMKRAQLLAYGEDGDLKRAGLKVATSTGRNSDQERFGTTFAQKKSIRIGRVEDDTR